MYIYLFFKRLLLRSVIKLKFSLLSFNLEMHYRKKIKGIIRANQILDINKNQKKEIKQYYKNKGYKNIKLHWHQFFIKSNNQFSVKYIPDDIFHPLIASRLNESKQWPALLDKNLLEVLFKDYKQPQSVIKNINGFYYVNDVQVNEEFVLKVCDKISEKLVIKPSIESGGGLHVVDFYVKNGSTSYKDMTLKELLISFRKDFIIQKVVNQNKKLKQLNASSLNTIRIISYLKTNSVNVISAVLRIGKSGMFTDNNSSGGIVCGITDKGVLRPHGYYGTGKRVNKTESGINLKGSIIPKYNELVAMAKALHKKVPYFKIISWDIAIDVDDNPVLIEYNTYKQDIRIHQLANGPVFENYLDEFLEIGKGIVNKN